MKQLITLACFVLIISYNSVSYSQKISAGIYSGVNYSDIHGNSSSGKWKYKPGPVQGISLDYSFLKVFGFTTGLNYSTFYYEHLPYFDKSYRPYYDVLSSSYLPIPVMYYFPQNEMMNFSFLTIPAQLRITIPSKPKLNLSSGVFYSFLQDYTIDNIYYLYSDYFDDKHAKKDYGYIYSAGISYPFTDDLNASFNISYITGRKEFTEDSQYRHGATSITLGVDYSGFLKKLRNKNQEQVRDSSNEKIHLIYKVGFNNSWNSGEYFSEKYSVNYGPSAGFVIDFRLSQRSSFQTGVSFERTGYSLRDSSNSFHRYDMHEDPEYYVDTKVGIDYIVIPALLNLSAGKTNMFFINTGPWLGLKLNANCKGMATSEISGSSSYQLTETVVYDDLEGEFQDYDLGWVLGGGVTIPLFDKYNLDLGIQFRKGFREVFDRSNLSTYDQSVINKTIIRNSSLAFQIGLRVPVY